LRELALRRTTEEVDAQLDEWMRESGREERDVDEHVLVFIDALPSARRLVRRGWRLAQGLRGDLLIGYLKRDFSDDEQVELARTIELAEDLNARILPLQTDDELKGLQGVIEAEASITLCWRTARAKD